MLMHVANITRNTVIATAVELADTGAKRSKGLLGRKCLDPGTGLWIVPCEAVHTFWMSFPIDLIYLNREYRIKKLCSKVEAWRLSACLSAYSVLELPSGTITGSQSETGDILQFSESSLLDGSHLDSSAGCTSARSSQSI
jgi:uncharacterized protein